MDGQQEDISPISDIGLNMDDDNGAVAENIPVDGEVILPNNQQWVWDGIKHRNNQNFKNEDDLMVGLSSETLTRYSPLTIFFPFHPLVNHLVYFTSIALERGNLKRKPKGKFVR